MHEDNINPWHHLLCHNTSFTTITTNAKEHIYFLTRAVKINALTQVD